MPAFKDPYDKGPKKPAPKPRARAPMFDDRPDSDQDIPDFIGGASEDGK